MLDDLPPEALLHGPPDADLVLQRTLRQMRSENSAQTATGMVDGGRGSGDRAGRGTRCRGRHRPRNEVEHPGRGRQPVAVGDHRDPSGLTVALGHPLGRTTDAATGATIDATVVPAAGWVRVNALVGGIPVGENCRLIVVGRNNPDGEIAGGWIVSAKGAQDGTPLNGSAAVPPGEVTAIKVVNAAGKTFVTLKI